MLLVKLLIDLICGALNAWGGYSFLPARRFIMPTILSLSCCFFIHSFWPLLMLASCGTLCLGYFSGQNWGRALWIGLQCFSLGLGLLFTHHLAWYFYLPYIVGGCVLGGFYKNWYQPLGDLVTGSYMGLIIFLVR